MHMMLALDESRYAESIIRWVAAFPRPERTRLTLIHVLEPLDVSPALVPEIQNRIMRRRRTEGRELLKKAERALRKRYPEITSILREGLPAYELLKIGRELHPDIIVCGTRGLWAAKGLPLGSVSQRLVGYSPSSIMLVPADLRRNRSLRVMLATDGSNGAKNAARLLSTFHGTRTVYVVTAVRPLDDRELGRRAASRKEFRQLREQILGDREAAAKRALDETARMLNWSGTIVKKRTVLGHQAEALASIAGRERADLLVVGSRGLTGLRAQAVGSVSMALAQQAPCCLLIAKPGV